MSITGYDVTLILHNKGEKTVLNKQMCSINLVVVLCNYQKFQLN
jgi:hypothetical protein